MKLVNAMMVHVLSGLNGQNILNVRSRVVWESNRGHVNVLVVLLVSIVSDWKKNLLIASQKNALHGLTGQNFLPVAPLVVMQPRSDQENVEMVMIVLVKLRTFKVAI